MKNHPSRRISGASDNMIDRKGGDSPSFQECGASGSAAAPKSRAAKFVFLTLCGLLLAGGFPAVAETVVFQNGVADDISDGIDCIDDTVLFEGNQVQNCGATKGIGVGNMPYKENRNRRHSLLLRCNVSPLKGATVTGPATLSLVQVNNSGATGDGTFEFAVYEVSPANADWIEGVGEAREGDTALDGEPTWKCKAAPETPWAGTPGLNDLGVDCGAEPVATMTFKEADGDNHVVDVSLPAALIQKWIDHPESNGGLLFVWRSGDRTIGGFRSSEWVPAQRPKLRVDYKK